MEEFATTTARWNVLANQTAFSPFDNDPDAVRRGFGSGDNWDGYGDERQLLLNWLVERRTPNPIVMTGDTHNNWVRNVPPDIYRLDAPPVATEFLSTSISTLGDPGDEEYTMLTHRTTRTSSYATTAVATCAAPSPPTRGRASSGPSRPSWPAPRRRRRSPPSPCRTASPAQCYRRLATELRQRRREAVRGVVAAQGGAHVAVVAPGGAGRDEDAPRREVGGELGARALREESQTSGPVPRGKATGWPPPRRPGGRAGRRRARGGAAGSARRWRPPTPCRPARARTRPRAARAARASPASAGPMRGPPGSPPSRGPSRTSGRRAGAGLGDERRRGPRLARSRRARRRAGSRPAGQPGGEPADGAGADRRARRVVGGGQRDRPRSRSPAAASSASTSAAPSRPSGTGTGRPPASCTSRGSGPQPGHAIATSPPPSAPQQRLARRAQQLARAVAGHDPPAPRRAGRRAPRAQGRAASGYAFTARRSANVDALTISACGGSCQAADVRSSAAARSAPGPSPRRAARGTGGRPPRARAPRTGGSSRRSAGITRGQRRRRALDDREPEGEDHQRDDRRHREDPRQHALLLVVPGRAPQIRQARSSRVAMPSVIISVAIIPANVDSSASVIEPPW